MSASFDFGPLGSPAFIRQLHRMDACAKAGGDAHCSPGCPGVVQLLRERTDAWEGSKGVRYQLVLAIALDSPVQGKVPCLH